jgi:hypothetical protein
MPVINAITTTYADRDSWDMAMYGIGQGSLVAYEGDEETLTITMKRVDQTEKGQLDEYDLEWSVYTSVKEADPDGEMGITSITLS